MFVWINKLVALLKYGRIPTIGDKEFKKGFLEFAYNEVPSSDIAASITAAVNTRLADPEKRDSAQQLALAARAFFELQERLYICYAETCELEWQVGHFYELHRMRGALSTHETQRMFVAKTEMLSQQLYASMSSLIRLLLHLKDRAFLNGMPNARVSEFLSFVETRYPELAKETQIVLRICHDYRGKYVDHQNQQYPYNWYTYDDVNKAAIVYYSKKDATRQLDISDQLSIGSFSAFPKLTIFPASSAFVPPHHTYAMRAYVAIARKLVCVPSL